jgi:hypothetical protein
VSPPDLGEQVAAEITHALQAAQAGNHAKARVCARRAAGWSLGGMPASGAGGPQAGPGNAYQALQSAASDESLPPRVRLAAARLTARVDETFSLPFEQNPLGEALEIIRWRWPGWQPPGI